VNCIEGIAGYVGTQWFWRIPHRVFLLASVTPWVCPLYWWKAG